MRRLIQSFLAAALVASALSAGAQDVDTSKKLVVGFPQIDENQPWRTAESDSFKSEAAKYNIDLKYVNAQDSQANQIAAIRSFIAQKVDAIVLPPKVETGWEPVLKEAKRASVQMPNLSASSSGFGQPLDASDHWLTAAGLVGLAMDVAEHFLGRD